MNSLLQIATSLAVPFVVAGCVLVGLFLVCHQIIARDIFPRLRQTHAFELLKAIVDKTFYLSLLVVCLAFIAYITIQLLPQWNSGPSKAELLKAHVMQLESTSYRVRTIALAELAVFTPDTAAQYTLFLDALTRLITQRSAERREPDLEIQNRAVREVELAFGIMGVVMQSAATYFPKHVKPEFKDVDISGANLANVYLAGTSFTDADLTEVNFDGANLSNVTVVGGMARELFANGATLSGAKFLTVCLENAKFARANLRGATFRTTDLNNANFAKADLTGAVFDNARVSQVDFRGSTAVNADFSTALEMTATQLNEVTQDAATLRSHKYTPSKLKFCKR